MNKVELLTPVKNLKVIKAASNYADSVYFGIEKFNMRMLSEKCKINFSNIQNLGLTYNIYELKR